MAEYQSYRPPPPDSSYAGPSNSNNAFDSIRRSLTRGSFHTTGTNHSTKSWVQHTSQVPQLPPEDSIVEQSFSPPARPNSRPLPQPQGRPLTLHTINADPREEEEEEEEEYMNIDPDISGAQYGYPTSEGVFLPRRMFTHSPPPMEPLSDPSKPSKSFVGGFVRGLRKIPKKLGYGAPGEKRGMFRKGTCGTETSTATLPRYQSKPTSPVATPSTIQYAHDVKMQPVTSPTPMPMPIQGLGGGATSGLGSGAMPTSLLSGGALRRTMPSFRVTPPSDSVSHESTVAAHYSHAQQPQFAQVVHPEAGVYDNMERATVMLYSDTNPDTSAMGDVSTHRAPSRHGVRHRTSTITIAPPPTIQHPPPAIPMPPPTTVAATNQGYGNDPEVQSPETEHPLPSADYLKMNRYGDAVTSPPRSFRAPTMFSRTTALTGTGVSSFYDPSFTSDLSPVERFFKTLYHLPWVARGRLTIDYRPGDEGSSGGKKGLKSGVKRPMASWYRRLSKTSTKELDLLSNGTPPRNLGMDMDTPRTSSNITASVNSRGSARNRRSSSSSPLRHHYTHQHHHGLSNQIKQQKQRNHGKRRKRRHRNTTMSTMTEEDEEEEMRRRSPSPVLPAVYPFAYPTYPYTYPGYAAVPPPLAGGLGGLTGQGTVLTTIPGSPNPQALGGGMPGVVNVSADQQYQQYQQQQYQQYQQQYPQKMDGKRSPKGPRDLRGSIRKGAKRQAAYPHGYSPYQPLAFPPPPIYVAVHSSPTLSHSSVPIPVGAGLAVNGISGGGVNGTGGFKGDVGIGYANGAASGTGSSPASHHQQTQYQGYNGPGFYAVPQVVPGGYSSGATSPSASPAPTATSKVAIALSS